MSLCCPGLCVGPLSKSPPRTRCQSQRPQNVGGSKGICTKFKMPWEYFTRSVATLPCLAADCSLHAHLSKPHSHPMFVLLLRILDPRHSHGLYFFSLLRFPYWVQLRRFCSMTAFLLAATATRCPTLIATARWPSPCRTS